MIKTEENNIIISVPKTNFMHKHELQQAIQQILKNNSYQMINVNLEETQYLASDFLGVLLWEKEQLSKKNIKLNIVNMSDTVKETLKHLKLENYFN